jgi:hypothetical protein
MAMKRRRIIVNNDFFNIFQIEPPVQDQDVCDAVDKVAGTQVDTLAVNIPGYYAQASYIDADLARLYAHPRADTCMENLLAFQAQGKDPFRMLLERARERGIEFWASLRMNDTHYKDHVFNPFIEQFYYDNLHNLVGEPEGRKNTEFDYRKTVVREHYLALLGQTVERYDVDGLELDFTRNCVFFPQDHPEECAPVMTQFVREVRGLLDEWGRRRGRRLVLAATVPHGLYECRRRGLDLPVWALLNLVDVVCLSSPFLARFDHDVRDARLKLPGVQVCAGCDRNAAYGFHGAGASRKTKFQDSVEVKIGSHWYVCSGYKNWRMIMHVKYDGTAGHWVKDDAKTNEVVEGTIEGWAGTWDED